MNTRKKIRAWAVLDAKEKVISIELTTKRPESFTIGTWIFNADKDRCVPCEITLITKKK